VWDRVVEDPLHENLSLPPNKIGCSPGSLTSMDVYEARDPGRSAGSTGPRLPKFFRHRTAVALMSPPSDQA
jgi:hypothetical protein